jgi:ATP-dependent DNA ligase
MIKLSDIILVTRNARDKIQTARYVLEQEGNVYTIKRFTGQFQGKITPQPEKTVEQGKAKRSALQQAELEFNSLVSKALDKGYKKFSDLTKISWESITPEELNKIVPSIKTDSNGNIKPQLAKSSNDCAISVFKNPLYGSRKLDGVRCLMTYDESLDTIHTVSRGGKDYDAATTHLRTNEDLLSMFRDDPSLILDGELYVHGWPLQRISGTCRLQMWESRCEPLEYWVYDLADSSCTFEERLTVLDELRDAYLSANSPIKLIDHILLDGWNELSKYHDKFVSEGFEGLVARKPDKKYAPGKRNSDWIKVKQYQDGEFEITGIEEGLRDEDMCFTLKTSSGKIFKAKPIGSRELRQEYLDNWPILVGKFGTVKFFAMSEDGIPMQPIFKSIREDGE